MRHICSPHALVAIVILSHSGTGCTIGSGFLKNNRGAYNEAIRRTSAEQLLLNIVRLRYGDAPIFLEIGSISANFNAKTDLKISAELNENVGTNPINADMLTLEDSFSFSDNPTITFAPLQDDEYTKRLLSPLPLDDIILLIQSGWPINKVLRLCVRTLNRQSNYRGPVNSIRYDSHFMTITSLLSTLDQRGVIAFGQKSDESPVSPTVITREILPEDFINAAADGLNFELVSEVTRVYQEVQFTLIKKERVPALRLSPALLGGMHPDKEGKQLYKLLRLDPKRTDFTLKRAENTSIVPLSDHKLSDVTISSRSLLEVLFYLSLAIEVPKQHKERVFTPTDINNKRVDWMEHRKSILDIRCSAFPPGNARLATRHLGYWFYVCDADLNSKATLGLLGNLFALRAGELKVTTPLQTIPVSGTN